MAARCGSQKRKDSVLGPGLCGIGPFSELVVFTDGAARGNPGPASIGVVIKDKKGHTVASFGDYIGTTTNNQAEYTALVHALRFLSAFQVERLSLRVDSELLARQLRGEYKVREPHLRTLHTQALSMLRRYDEWRVEEIPRERNREADALANGALDAALAENGPSSRGTGALSPSPQEDRQGELFQ